MTEWRVARAKHSAGLDHKRNKLRLFSTSRNCSDGRAPIVGHRSAAQFSADRGGVSFTRTAERVGRTQAAANSVSNRWSAIDCLREVEGWSAADPKGGTPRPASERACLAQRRHCWLSRKRTSGNVASFRPILRVDPSIAVLPFQDMSDDPGQQYFADGIVDDLISRLSRIRWLVVVARDFLAPFAEANRSTYVRIGKTLGVRYVLLGGLRKVGWRGCALPRSFSKPRVEPLCGQIPSMGRSKTFLTFRIGSLTRSSGLLQCYFSGLKSNARPEPHPRANGSTLTASILEP